MAIRAPDGANNLQEGGGDLKLQWEKKPTCSYERPSSGCLKPRHMATSYHDSAITKSFWTWKNWTRFYHLTIHLEESNNTKKPLNQETCITKSLRVERNTFPNLREGDTPQGKARVSKLLCWDLEKPNTSFGPRCSAAREGEWLCRVQAQGEHTI